MKKTAFYLLLAIAIWPLAGFSQSRADTLRRMQWFDDAKLGIFIHWGIYAVRGVSESWSFYNNYLPYDEYMSQCKGFKASRYNPEEWVRLIKESGARYAVITSKHHDGVALWDTRVGSLSITKSTPAKRDVLTPFCRAVREAGLRLGLYYSLLDWSHPDYPNWSRTVSRYLIKDEPARWERFVAFNKAQLTELSTKFNPDLYWFDGDWEQTAEDWHAAEIVEQLRAVNPDVVINSRIQGYGDYATPEQGVPTQRPKERWWELCMTMNDSWGWQPQDTNFKTAHMLLRTFCDCLSMGGNMLLDIGPRQDGTIPEEEVAILREFGRWTTKHAEAVYGTRAGIPAQFFQGYTALSPDATTLYLYLPYRPGDGQVEVKGLMNRVNRVWVVGNGTMLPYKVYNKNYWSEVPGNLYISVPDDVLDPQITVLAVLLNGPVRLYAGQGQVITAN
ncbi:MAG: alpha-L-fucosidase [Bacteroidaceae bacterium]|nr:alpha-L-fucosidase [Bacteroidaceae bacterium]